MTKLARLFRVIIMWYFFFLTMPKTTLLVFRDILLKGEEKEE